MQGWLEVELAATDAWAAVGKVPADVAALLRERASFTVEAVKERERTTNHDVAAFVDVVAASIGEEGRWIHYGLTSSDVLDTALGAAARRGRRNRRQWRRRLSRRARRQGTRACDDPVRRAHAWRPCRADDVRPAPRRLCLRGATATSSACAVRSSRRPSASSPGAVGTYASIPPAVEVARDGAARAARRGRLDPGGTPRPSRRGPASDRARRRRARALRPGDPKPPAHRGA